MKAKITFPKCKQHDAVKRQLKVNEKITLLPTNQKYLVVDFDEFPLKLELCNIDTNNAKGGFVNCMVPDANHTHGHQMTIEIQNDPTPIPTKNKDKVAWKPPVFVSVQPPKSEVEEGPTVQGNISVEAEVTKK